ncbi:hypothetical protein D3C80_2003990 [compost metagenome]
MTMRSEDMPYTRLEREILAVVMRMNGYIRPIDIVNECKLNLRTVRKCLKSLCEKGKLRPIETRAGGKICRYEYIHSFQDEFFIR